MRVISAAAAAVTVPKKVTRKHPNPLLKSKENKIELTRRNKKIWNWTRSSKELKMSISPWQKLHQKRKNTERKKMK